MIEEITAWKLRIPLSEPYHLSHTTVENYDTILVKARYDGLTGWGESTFLTNYSNIDVDEAWEMVNSLIDSLVGKTREEASAAVDEEIPYSFVKSSLLTAIQIPEQRWSKPASIPVVGVLSVQDEDPLKRVDDLVSEGYKTIKIKIGFEAENDAEKVSEIIDRASQEIQFRVDANQAYDLEASEIFLENVCTDRLQLLEQPIGIDKLKEHRKLRENYDINIMLDEDVVTINDVSMIRDERAADLIKFKMMKQGGFQKTQKIIKYTQTNTNLGIVLGNGVQTGIGSLQEGQIWTERDLHYTGEFNGWIKSSIPIIQDVYEDNGELSGDLENVEFPNSLIKDHINE